MLTGEMPDPTRIPAGCRFHPRCPALADGRGGRGRRRRRRAAATPLDRCLPAPARTGTTCACHLVARRSTTARRRERDVTTCRPRCPARCTSTTRHWARRARRGCCSASGSASAGVDDLGLRRAAAGRRRRRGRRVGAGDPRRATARCTRRTTSAGTAAPSSFPRRARVRAGAARRRRAALPLPLVDLRPGRLAAARRRTPTTSTIDRPTSRCTRSGSRRGPASCSCT